MACGADNRLAEHGWQVRIRDGVAEWIPPPDLDVGQTRINYLHHPERLLVEAPEWAAQELRSHRSGDGRARLAVTAEARRRGVMAGVGAAGLVALPRGSATAAS